MWAEKRGKMKLGLVLYAWFGLLHYSYWLLLLKSEVKRPKWFLWLVYPLFIFYGIMALACGVFDKLFKVKGEKK